MVSDCAAVNETGCVTRLYPGRDSLTLTCPPGTGCENGVLPVTEVPSDRVTRMEAPLGLD